MLSIWSSPRLARRDSVGCACTYYYTSSRKRSYVASWLTCIYHRFQAYASCCILLYDAVQKLLWNLPERDWSRYLGEVDLCLEVLFYGGKYDPISRKLHNALKIYASMLHAARTSTEEGDADSPSSSNPGSLDSLGRAERSGYLFATRNGDSLFHHAARRLLILVCRPYGSRESMDILDLPIGAI